MSPSFRPRVRAPRIILAAGLMLVSLLIAAAHPAAAVDNGTVGIRPSNESDFFHLNLYPGAATDATAIVSNHTPSAVSLLTYPVDGQTTPQGSFALAAQSDPRKGVGAWVQLSTDHLLVPAKSEVRVKFRLTVPPGTVPGDYAGGLIIQSPPVRGKTTTVGGTAVRLDVIQRQGVRIYLKVAGTAVRSLKPGKLTWHHEGDILDFLLPVTNTGNTILKPTAKLDIDGWPVNDAHVQFTPPESLLPGATVQMQARLRNAPLAQTGDATATITSEAGTARVAASILYAPWLLLTGLGLLLIATGVAVWRAARFVHRARAALAQTNAPHEQCPFTGASGRHAEAVSDEGTVC